MRNTLMLMGMLAAVVACSEGDGRDDEAAGDETGTIGDDSGGSTGSDSGMTSATTATTATTLTSATTDPTGDDESSTASPEDTGDIETTGTAELGCAEYCGLYLVACADHDAYANEQDCMDNCAQWPIGDATDTAHDSLGCRTYHATVASSTDPELHCPHASPSGAGTCIAEEAPTCDVYCTRYFENCTGDLNAFADMAECMTVCADWYPGSFKDTDGHTVGCHSYHADAAMGDAELHCPHAAPGGGGICVL